MNAEKYRARVFNDYEGKWHVTFSSWQMDYQRALMSSYNGHYETTYSYQHYEGTRHARQSDDRVFDDKDKAAEYAEEILDHWRREDAHKVEETFIEVQSVADMAEV